VALAEAEQGEKTEQSEQTVIPNHTENNGVEPSPAATDNIQKQLDSMSLEEKIGQMIIVGVDGYTSNAHAISLLEDYHVGGFILFKNNIRDAGQALDLINSLKTSNSKNRLPLFMAVDEEGGRVTRMPDQFGKIPAAGIIGKLNDTDLSYDIGKVLAKEIKALGFNMNFAPILDINSNPKNPVIGDRAFGTEPGIVTDLGTATMKGIQSENVISVVKHFPGHGDTSVDSHVGLPVVYNDLDRLENFELLPFKQAVKDGADAVMIAHILLPKIDSENPASLSKTFITDILRGKLGFDGVTVTDDMTMGAISKRYDVGQAAVKSINAGSDIILVCHEYDRETSVIKTMLEAAQKGIIKEETIDKSVYRILKLKEKYGLTDSRLNSVDITQTKRLIDNINDEIKER
jgi:beta-N-acetylhexosaminidase